MIVHLIACRDLLVARYLAFQTIALQFLHEFFYDSRGLLYKFTWWKFHWKMYKLDFEMCFICWCDLEGDILNPNAGMKFQVAWSCTRDVIVDMAIPFILKFFNFCLLSLNTLKVAKLVPLDVSVCFRNPVFKVQNFGLPSVRWEVHYLCCCIYPFPCQSAVYLRSFPWRDRLWYRVFLKNKFKFPTRGKLAREKKN